MLAGGKIRDSFRFWPISLSFLITGLTTTAIIAGITPSNTLFHIHIAYTLYPDDDYCTLVNSTKSNGWYNWLLPNGSYFQVNTTQNAYQACATQQALSLAPAIKSFGGGAMPTYVFSKVSVLPSAIGVPFVSNPTYTDFSETFGAWGPGVDLSLLQSATACLPVFGKSPVQCYQAENVTVGDNEVSVNAGGCNITTPIFGVDPKTQGASSSGACTPGSIG